MAILVREMKWWTSLVTGEMAIRESVNGGQPESKQR